MPIFLPTFGASLIASGSQLSANPAELPWYQSGWMLWLGVCLLVFAGLILGYILFKSDAQAAAETVTEAESEKALTEKSEAIRNEIEADFERTRASLQGEADAAKFLIEQQRTEIQRRDEKLALTQNQLDEKQRRMSELVELTEQSPTGPGNRLALAHAQASVIQLAEIIKGERQKIGTGISRLEQTASRVQDLNEQVWDSLDHVSPLREKLAEDGGKRAKAMAKSLTKLEDKLRVHHQSATGCIQHAEETRKQLQSRQDNLRAIFQPVSCVEKRVEALAESDDDEIWSAELETAANELEVTRDLVNGFENGIQQEIAEINGRVDWLTNDSATGFVSALEDFQQAKAPHDPELKNSVEAVERKMNGLRNSLDHFSELLPQGDFVAKKGSPQRIRDAFEKTVSALRTAAIAPAEPTETSPIPPLEDAVDVQEIQSELEGLRNQLTSEQDEARQLRESLESTQNRLSELEMEKQPAENGHSSSGIRPFGFMRRMMNLGPDRREKAQLAAREVEKKVSREMTQPQLSIAALQTVAATVDTDPVSATSSAEVDELRQSVVERDTKIAALESEIRQLTAPIPLPSEIGATAMVEEKPKAAKIPEVTILPLTADRFAEPEPEPDTGQEIVIFRGDDPRRWNTESHDAHGNFSQSLADLPDSIQFIRLKRLDTGESITIPISRDELIAGASLEGTRGWSGKAEQYFGSVHLGIFDETLPVEVETKFGAGGWGFGHRYQIGSGQAFTWEGKEIPPVRFEISVATEFEDDAEDSENSAPIIPADGLVIFRSNDPGLWNHTIYQGANRRARALDDLPNHDSVKWLRLKRCDSGESVLLPISQNDLATDGGNETCGFNGTAEEFYGARHLGVFDAACALDVETKFTLGGWGFGHHSDPADGETQAASWAGKPIDSQTVFEITVFAQMPDTGPKDTVLRTS